MDAKMVCLGVLALGEASGYEIRKQFEEGPFAHFQDAGYGSIYPALNALHAERLVTYREMTQPGRPAKKVYSITEAGTAAFRRALHAETARDRYRSDALFKLYFAEMMDDDGLARVHAEYRERYRAAIERMESRADETMLPARRFVHDLGLTMYRALVAYLDEHKDALFEANRNDQDVPAARAAGGER